MTSRRLFITALAFLALTACASERPRPGVQGGPPGGGVATQPLPGLTPGPDANRGPQSGPPRVALLLPLTGPNAALGQAMRDAAQMAQSDNAARGFQLLVRDTGGTQDGAARAAAQVIGEGARLILGPLLAAEAVAIASQATAAGISVITFSNDRGIARPGVYVFGFTPQGQIERLVAYARSRGLTRYAGFVPNNVLGQAAEEALRGAVGSAGGEVTQIERYDAGDPTVAARRLAGGEIPRGQRASVNYEALLLPDQGDRLLTVAPLINFVGIDTQRVRLLGLQAMGADPRARREPSLAGAWYAAPSEETRADFERRYREAYNREPPAPAVLAYDAVAMAARLARAQDGADYSTESLTRPTGFTGMNGLFRLRADGTVERGYAIYEVGRDGSVRVVARSPASFEAPGQ